MLHLAWKRAIRNTNGTVHALYDQNTVYIPGRRTRSTTAHGLSVCATPDAALAHDVPNEANDAEAAAHTTVLIACLVRQPPSPSGKTLVRSMVVLCTLDSQTIGGERILPLAMSYTRYKHGYPGHYTTRTGIPIQYPNAYRRRGWSTMVHVRGVTYTLTADLTLILDHVRALVYSLRRAYPPTWR